MKDKGKRIKYNINIITPKRLTRNGRNLLTDVRKLEKN